MLLHNLVLYLIKLDSTWICQVVVNTLLREHLNVIEASSIAWRLAIAASVSVSPGQLPSIRLHRCRPMVLVLNGRLVTSGSTTLSWNNLSDGEGTSGPPSQNRIKRR